MDRRTFEQAWAELPRDERAFILERAVEIVCRDVGLEVPPVRVIETAGEVWRAQLPDGELRIQEMGKITSDSQMREITINAWSLDTKGLAVDQIDNPWEIIDSALHEAAHHIIDVLRPEWSDEKVEHVVHQVVADTANDMTAELRRRIEYDVDQNAAPLDLVVRHVPIWSPTFRRCCRPKFRRWSRSRLDRRPRSRAATMGISSPS